MPVKKEPSGRRSVEAEIEVPGTPEQVWEAIASGPGISAWFVPTTLDGRAGGTTVSSFGPDDSMDSVARITEWEPRKRYVAESEGGPGTIATEWTVEAKGGGTCTVRVVHSWFASTDDWDSQFEQHTLGWSIFFKLLRLYLEHFPGEACSPVQLMPVSTNSQSEAWDRLASPLGLAGAPAGARVTTTGDAPELEGIVENVSPPEYPGVILRLDKPAPALAHFFVLSFGGPVMLPVRFYLYGEAGSAAAPDVETTWRAWLEQRFPSS